MVHKKNRKKQQTQHDLWEDLAGHNEIFHEEFARVIPHEDTLEADDIFDPEEFGNYVNM